MKNKRVAAIDIGSSAIRMTICEVVDGNVVSLEELRQHTTLGKDIFDIAKIQRSTIAEIIHILKNYKKLYTEYKVDVVKAVSTTSIRVASNVDVFIDNISSALGIDVEILSTMQEIEYIYKALRYNKNYDESEDSKYKGIIEIGSGSVDIIIYNKKCIVFSRSFPMGAVKIKQIFDNATNIEDNFLNYIRVMIDHELRTLKREIPSSKINILYGLSAELEVLVNLINKDDAKRKFISKDEIAGFISKIQGWSEEEIIHNLNIPYDYAETFHTKSFMLLKIIDFFECDKIYIPKVSLRDGMIYDMIATTTNESHYEQTRLQLKVNSINIGRKLNYDEKHALKVMNIALKLFNETKELHRLTDKEKLYLMCAAILHDVGSSLSRSSHHKHSLYIIKSQDFFFFDETQVNIVANIARYHRRSIPKAAHPDYNILSRENKMIVMKLAAILRIADSLDNTHLQLVDDIRVTIIRDKSPKVIINAISEANIFAESYCFKYKRDLFEFIYGIPVKLRIKKR